MRNLVDLGGQKEHDRHICSRIQVILQKIFLYVMLGFPAELVSLQVFQMDENGLFDVLHQSRSKLHFSFWQNHCIPMTYQKLKIFTQNPAGRIAISFRLSKDWAGRLMFSRRVIFPTDHLHQKGCDLYQSDDAFQNFGDSNFSRFWPVNSTIALKNNHHFLENARLPLVHFSQKSMMITSYF